MSTKPTPATGRAIKAKIAGKLEIEPTPAPLTLADAMRILQVRVFMINGSENVPYQQLSEAIESYDQEPVDLMASMSLRTYVIIAKILRALKDFDGSDYSQLERDAKHELKAILQAFEAFEKHRANTMSDCDRPKTVTVIMAEYEAEKELKHFMIVALKNALDALYNVPCVGEKYDRQHADTHMNAAHSINELLKQNCL